MNAKKTWAITDAMVQGRFTADAVGRSDADYLKATNKARIDACIKEDLEDKLHDINEQLGVIYDIRYSGSGRYTVEYSARGFGRGKNDWERRQSVVRAPAPVVKDASPVKTGGTVQRELEARQVAGWMKRSGGKDPGWYVYQDGQSYAGPYESKAKGEEGLKLANKLHPGHKYELRVVGTKDADIGNAFIPHKHFQDFPSEEKAQEFIKYLKKNGAKNIATSSDRDRLNNKTRYRVAWDSATTDANPMALIKEANALQIKLQRSAKGSAEWAEAKKKLDAIIEEMSKANRAYEAKGGKYRSSSEGRANRANADSKK